MKLVNISCKAIRSRIKNRFNMKNVFLTLATMLVILLSLFSCEDNNEISEQITVNDLIVRLIDCNSVEVSGTITNNFNSNIINGGYYIGKYESVDSIINKEILNKKICDTLLINPNQEYWIQSFITTKTGNTIKGEKINFRTFENPFDYKIIYEKYVTLPYEINSLSDNRYYIKDCIFDANDNIIIVGGVASNYAEHPHIIKLDKNGNYLWHHTFTNHPSKWSEYTKVLLTNENYYLTISFDQENILYITKISLDGNLISNTEIEFTDSGAINPGGNCDIRYDKENDLFTLYAKIVKIVDGIDISYRIVKFNSKGTVMENRQVFSNDFFTIKYVQDNGNRYCIGYRQNGLTPIAVIDENMNILRIKELSGGYDIQELAMRGDNILVVAMNYSAMFHEVRFFEIDKNLTEFRELSEQWDISDPYVYDCFIDKNGNVFISGGNSPYWFNLFNEFGALCMISEDNKILYKEQNFGEEFRIPGKITITRHQLIRQMSDNSLLLIGLFNPDYYDGPISKIYLRKFSYKNGT